MASNTQIVKQGASPIQTLRTMLDRSKDQIALALPKHITPERMMRVAITAVQKQPKLLECSPLSIVGAVVEASQLGLEPDGILGQAYLVPFWNGKTRQMEAQLQPGYRGLIALARRSGEVSSISAEIVYKSDKFSVKFGVHRDLVHEPALDDPKREESGIRGAYATVLYRDSTYDFEYLSLAELEKVRDASKSRDREGNLMGPWASHPTEMMRKCPIRRLAKRLPLSAEFQKAATLDEYVDAGIAPSMEQAVDAASEAAKMATEFKVEQMKEKYLPREEEQGIPESAPLDEIAQNPMEAPLEATPVERENPSQPTGQDLFAPRARRSSHGRGEGK